MLSPDNERTIRLGIGTRISDAETLVAVRALHTSSNLTPLATTLIDADMPNASTLAGVSDVLDDMLFRPDRTILAESHDVSTHNAYQPTRSTTERIHITNVANPVVAAQFGVQFVGTGPGSLIPARVLRDNGFPVRLVDPKPHIGGIWGDGIQSFNNPADVQVQGEELLTAPDRDGDKMRAFLADIANPLMQHITRGTATSAVEDINGNIRLVTEQADGSQTIFNNANQLIVALGNTPKPLVSEKMASNISKYEQEVIRWQGPITKEKALELDGKKVLFIGFGNSTGKMIQNIESANRLYRTNIKPLIITHFTGQGLETPNSIAPRADGTLGQFGRTAENLTRYEVDLPESERILRRYRAATYHVNGSAEEISHGTFNGTRDFYLDRHDDGTFSVTVNRTVQFGIGNSYPTTNVAHGIGAIYGLVGYGADQSTMEQMGFTYTDGKPNTNDHDNRAKPSFSFGPSPKIYAMGTAAVKPGKPNSRVIPGIVNDTRELLVTTVIEATKHFLR